MKLKWPFGLTALFTLLALLMLFGGLECLLRIDHLHPYLIRLIPSLGGRHLQMEEQLARLEEMVAVDGHVDCVMLGSSLVWLGFDPPVFEDAYKQAAGQDVHCFDLGIETLPANAASLIARVVVQRYHPRLLIYGTSARDYAIDISDENSRVVYDTPWLQYQAGKQTPWNSFVSNSYAFRYMGRLGDLLKFDEGTWTDLRSAPATGFLGKTGAALPVHFEAAARDAARWFRPYEIRPVNLDALSEIAGLKQGTTDVIVVEMPVSDGYFAYMEKGKEDYDRFIQAVSERLAADDTIFLRSMTDNPIPASGWWDKSHMNKTGADKFSQWLAQQIADLVRAGKIGSPILVATDTQR